MLCQNATWVSLLAACFVCLPDAVGRYEALVRSAELAIFAIAVTQSAFASAAISILLPIMFCMAILL